MITLVIGGADSGKSEYAEHCLDHVQGEKIYIATMIASDPESRERVHRHRRRRLDRNFRTMECPACLEKAALLIPADAAVLLEGIGTLVANELFCDMLPDPDAAKSRIMNGIHAVISRAGELVIVSDEVNRAGFGYQGDTRLYQKLIGELNQELCRLSDRVAEMVCGFPVLRSCREITSED